MKEFYCPSCGKEYRTHYKRETVRCECGRTFTFAAYSTCDWCQMKPFPKADVINKDDPGTGKCVYEFTELCPKS